MQLVRTRPVLPAVPLRFPLPVLVVGLVVTSLVACGDDSSSGDAPTTADLDGRQFVATDIEGHTIVDGSEVVMSFEDGAVSIQAGCNTQNGGYEVVDGVLRVEALMATMMACEDALMAQDQLVADVVTGSPTVELDGDELVIAAADATISLTART